MAKTLEELKDGLTPEAYQQAKAQIDQSEKIMITLNKTFTDLIYTEKITSLRDINLEATSSSIEMVRNEFLNYLEEHKEVPPISPEVFIKIIAGVHLNTLRSMFAETVVENLWVGFIESTEQAIMETLVEYVDPDQEIEKEPQEEEDK